jgi:hypothetical protein
MVLQPNINAHRTAPVVYSNSRRSSNDLRSRQPTATWTLPGAILKDVLVDALRLCRQRAGPDAMILVT